MIAAMGIGALAPGPGCGIAVWTLPNFASLQVRAIVCTYGQLVSQCRHAVLQIVGAKASAAIAVVLCTCTVARSFFWCMMMVYDDGGACRA